MNKNFTVGILSRLRRNIVMMLTRRIGWLLGWIDCLSKLLLWVWIASVELLWMLRLLPSSKLLMMLFRWRKVCRLIELIWTECIWGRPRRRLRFIHIQIQKFTRQFVVLCAVFAWRSRLRSSSIFQAVVDLSCFPFSVLTCFLNTKIN